MNAFQIYPRLFRWSGLATVALVAGCAAVDDDAADRAGWLETGLTSTTSTTIGAEADTYVRSGSYAASSYGSATSVQVDASDSGTMKRGYIRFRIGDVGAITRARVRFYVTNGSSSSLDLHRISSTTWAESITWNTAPAVDGPRLASLGSTTGGAWVEIDVTSEVAPSSVLSLALVARSTDGFAFSSRDASANHPQLVLDRVATIGDPGSSSGASRGYLTTPGELAAIKSKADRGLQPYAAAVSALLADAGTPASWSHGVVDPCDRDRLHLAAAHVYAKSMAFRLVGDPAYAVSARAKILELAATTSAFGGETYSGGNGCILTLARHIPGYVMGADLLEGWSGWSAADKTTFQKWLGSGVYRKID